MKFNSRQFMQDWKCSIEEHYLKVAWVYSKTDGSPRSWPCSHAMSTLDHWFETGPIFLPRRYRFSFISLLDQVSSSSSGTLSTRIFFLCVWFSRNSILWSLLSFHDLWMSLFIRNLSYGVKPYLKYNQLQLQTLDITKFCMRQRKLTHYHNHHYQMVLFLD